MRGMRPTYRETPREPRIPYAGTLRVLLDFAPWKLALSLAGLNLSTTGVLGHLEPGDAGSDVDQLLQVGDPYQLQLEHDSEHLPVPVLSARLVRREPTPRGLVLAFGFDAPGSELLGLIHELGTRPS